MALIDIARASAKSLQKKIDAQNSTKTGATVTPAPAMRPTIAPASGRARSAGARAVTLTKQDGTTEGSTLGAFMVERGNAERAKKAAEEKERNEAIAYSQYLQNEAAKVSPKLAPSGYPSGWSELAKRTKEDAKDLSKTVPLSIASSGADIIKGAGDLIASIPLQTTNQAVNAMYGYTPAWVDPAVPTNLDMLKVQMTPQLEAAMRAEVDPENKSGATTRELLIDREVADTGATDPLKKWHEFTAPLNTPRKLREEIYARQQARGLLPIEQKLLSGIDSAAENAIPIALGGGLGTDLVFGLQVLGQSVENALAAGADYDTALANGVMSAVAEVGIEKLSGGLGSINKIGAVQIAGDAMKARLPAAVAEFLAKMPKSLTKFIAFAGDIGGEGLEEFAGAFIEPYITRATINPNASNATLDEAIDAGIIGMVSALFISGAQLAADGIMTAAEKNAAKKEAERVRAEINNYIGEYNKRPENRRAPLPAVAEQTRGTSRTPSPTAEAVQTPASAEAPPLERGQGDSLAIENNHTPEQARVMREYEAAVDTGVIEFLKNNKGNNKAFYEVGEVNKKHADMLKQLTGRDYSGYVFDISGHTGTHIEARHGETGTHDNTMSNDEDIARVKYVLDNFDNARIVGTNTQYQNSDGTVSDELLISKRIDGYYHVVEAVPNSKRKILRIVSTYQSKNSTGVFGADELNSSQLTPNRSGASMATVSQTESDVKGETQTPQKSPLSASEVEGVKLPAEVAAPVYKNQNGAFGTQSDVSAAVNNNEMENNYEQSTENGAEIPRRGEERISDVTDGANDKSITVKRPERDYRAAAAEANRRADILKAAGETVRQINPWQLGVIGGEIGVGALMPVYSEASYDEGMRDIKARADEMGMGVTFVGKPIYINGKRARGAYTANGDIVIQANNRYATAEQIFEHERFHAAIKRGGTVAARDLKNAREVLENGNWAGRFNELSIDYFEQYKDVIPKGMSVEEIADYIAEEILADAVAGLNEFSGGVVAKIAEGVRNRSEQAVPVARAQETNAPRAPPRSDAEEFGYYPDEDTNADRYAIEYPAFTEREINENVGQMLSMKSVKNLAGNEFAKSDIPLRMRIDNLFASPLNKMSNPALGDVSYQKSTFNDELNHGLTNQKVIAFAAVPLVVNKGKVIDYKSETKKEPYARIVVAAPITIAGNPYYCGVMIHRDAQTQKLYIHDVVTVSSIENASENQNVKMLNTEHFASDNQKRYLTDIIRDAIAKYNSQNQQNNEIIYEAEAPASQGLNKYPKGRETAASENAERNAASEQNDFNNHSDTDNIVSQKAADVKGEKLAERDSNDRKLTPEQIKSVDNKKPTSDPDIRYALASDEDGESVKITADIGITPDMSSRTRARMVQEYMKNTFRGVEIDVGDGTVKVNRRGIEKYTSMMGTEKAKAVAELDNLLKAAEYESYKPDTKNHNFARDGWDYYRVRFTFDGEEMFSGRINIALDPTGDTFYDMDEIKKQSSLRRDGENTVGRVTERNASNTDTVSQNEGDVKGEKFDLENDDDLEVFKIEWPTGGKDVQRAAENAENDRRNDEMFGGNSEEERQADAERRSRERDGLAQAMWGEESVGSYEQKIWKTLAEREAEEVMSVAREGFKATETLEKLGIKIDGSLANIRYDQTEQMLGRHEAAKEIKREIRKTEAKLVATDDEKADAAAVASGTKSIDNLSRVSRKSVVEELAELYLFEEALGYDMIREQRDHINRTLTKSAERLLRDAGDVKPSNIIVLNHRTPKRTMLRVFGEKLGGEINRTVFDPIDRNTAERDRWVNKQLNRVRTFEDENGKRRALTPRERAIVQGVIEEKAIREKVKDLKNDTLVNRVAKLVNEEKSYKQIKKEIDATPTQMEQGYQLQRMESILNELDKADYDKKAVDAAAKKYTEIYDEMYGAINDFLAAHGYEPIGFVKGYAPHMQAPEIRKKADSYFDELGVKLPAVRKLPTEIAGLTAEFKPNKRYDPHFQTRYGNNTMYDAAAGFEDYLDYISDVFYHTDDIMRLRAMTNYLRRRFATDEIQARIDRIGTMEFAPAAEKRAFLVEEGIFENADAPTTQQLNAALSDFTHKTYEDLQSKETKTRYGEFVMMLENYTNLLAGKQSFDDRGLETSAGRASLNWANRIIKWFGRAQVAGNISSALNNTAQLAFVLQANGPVNTGKAIRDIMKRGGRSTILDKSDFLTSKKGVTPIVMTPFEKITEIAFKPIEIVDGTISMVAYQGAYYRAIKRGMEVDAAARFADKYAQDVMGSRAKGAKPIAFDSKNPLTKMMHQFQIEALNSWDHIYSDLSLEVKKYAAEHGAKKTVGKVAASVFGYLLTAFTLNRLDEELYGGTPIPFDLIGFAVGGIAAGKGLSTNKYLLTALDNAYEKVTGERLGTERLEPGMEWKNAFEDLRYNISNEVPFLRNISGLMGWGDETLPLPDIKGAIDKIAKAAAAEGSKAQKAQDIGTEVLNLVFQAVPLGRQMTKTTAGLNTMLQGGKLNGYGDAKRLQYTVDGTLGKWVQALIFGNTGLSESRDFYASGNTGLSAAQTKKFNEIVASGAKRKELYTTVQMIRAVPEVKDSDEDGLLKRSIITAADLTDFQKADLYAMVIPSGEETAEKLRTLMNYGLKWQNVIDVYNVHKSLDDNEEMTASEKAGELEPWIDAQGYTAAQTKAVKEKFRFWSQIPAEATRYEAQLAAGISVEKAKAYNDQAAALEPLPGAKYVSETQRLRVAMNVGTTDEERIQMMSAVYGESDTGKKQLARVQAGYELGVTPKFWVTFRELLKEAETDDPTNDDTTSKVKKQNAIDHIAGVTQVQKAVIYQMQAGKQGSVSSNPYAKGTAARKAAEKYRKAMGWD